MFHQNLMADVYSFVEQKEPNARKIFEEKTMRMKSNKQIRLRPSATPMIYAKNPPANPQRRKSNRRTKVLPQGYYGTDVVYMKPLDPSAEELAGLNTDIPPTEEQVPVQCRRPSSTSAPVRTSSSLNRSSNRKSLEIEYKSSSLIPTSTDQNSNWSLDMKKLYYSLQDNMDNFEVPVQRKFPRHIEKGHQILNEIAKNRNYKRMN